MPLATARILEAGEGLFKLLKSLLHKITFVRWPLINFMNGVQKIDSHKRVEIEKKTKWFDHFDF